MIGILALQGGYYAHQEMFKKLNTGSILVTTPAHLDAIDALVIPGGESSTMLHILKQDCFENEVASFVAKGKPVLGTCAGAILLASTVDPHQSSLNAINMTIKRNAYGRQVDSHISDGTWQENNATIPMVFIRAPVIQAIGSEVKILATCHDLPVCVQHNNCIAATFHPELSHDTRLHEYFLECIRMKMTTQQV